MTRLVLGGAGATRAIPYGVARARGGGADAAVVGGRSRVSAYGVSCVVAYGVNLLLGAAILRLGARHIEADRARALARAAGA